MHRKALGVAFKPTAKWSLGRAARRDFKADREMASGRLRTGSITEFHFYPAIKQLTLNIAARPPSLASSWGAQANAIQPRVPGMVGPMVRVRRARAHSRHAEWLFLSFLSFVRVPAGQATDLYSELCCATKEDGSLLTDQEIAEHMSFLISWRRVTIRHLLDSSLIYLLGKHPEWQDKLRAEMHGLAVSPSTQLPYERLGE